MAEVRRIGLDEVARHFEELEDPRSSINRKHPLVSVVVIALMAVLAGAGGPTAIAGGRLERRVPHGVLDLPNGIPRKDVFRRVLMPLKPAAFQACFANWLQSLRRRPPRRPAWSNRSSRWTARRPGGATIAGTDWAPCIR